MTRKKYGFYMYCSYNNKLEVTIIHVQRTLACIENHIFVVLKIYVKPDKVCQSVVKVL